MDKVKVAALLAVGVAVGAGGSQLAEGVPPTPTTTVINTKLVRETLADGGVRWNSRTCAYEELDGKHTEPCWYGVVTGGEAATLEQALLNQKR